MNNILQAGEELEILQAGGDWWLGKNKDGKQGFFPGNYVEKLGSW